MLHGSEKGGWSELEAVIAIGSIGAMGAGIAMYKPNPCTSEMSEGGCKKAQEKNDLAVTAMVVGVLAGLLLVTEKAHRALAPVPAKR